MRIRNPAFQNSFGVKYGDAGRNLDIPLCTVPVLFFCALSRKITSTFMTTGQRPVIEFMWGPVPMLGKCAMQKIRFLFSFKRRVLMRNEMRIQN
jgi:hypothetical protein